MTDPLLSVRDLAVEFETDDGVRRAVDGVDFDVAAGETVCLVGESGSGKTVTCEALTRVLRTPPARVDGEVRFRGRAVGEMSEARLRDLRGGRVGHVFQNPGSALNHCYSVGWQIAEAVRLHADVSRGEARERAVDLLDRVGIPGAADRVDDYPHEFSGGMTQRVAVAMALAADPDLLVADEPTTGLDVTTQAEILRLLDDVQAEFGTSVLFVTHDLGVVAEIADRVLVMYAGKIVESGDVVSVFEDPAHPYTRALLACLPGRGGEATAIDGSLPDPADPPDGCRFADRCPHAVADCRSGDHPAPVELAADHRASCLLHRPGYDASALRDGSTGDDAGADGEVSIDD